MPEFKKAYVTVMVDDLDKSVDFYHKLLGLYEDLRFGNDWAEMVTKGITIGLHPKKHGAPPELAAKMGWNAVGGPPAGQRQGPPPGVKAEGQVTPSGASAGNHSAPHISIGFEVADIRKTAKELEEKGIRFHFQENEVNILAFFRDPDGTPLYLTQVR
jgi:catechol 2,3-dioxygenase-like lactoylglutathione lyase family enzyme